MAEKKDSNLLDCIEKIVLVFFLLSIVLSIKKVFFLYYPTTEHIFNEYTDISLYLSDTLLASLAAIIILRNKKKYLSIVWWRHMFHVEHFKWVALTPVPFILWSFLSIFWSESALLAVFSLIKVLEGYLLYLIVVLYFVPRGTSQFHNSSDILFHVEQNSDNFAKIVPRGTNYVYRFIENCSTWNKMRVCFLIFMASGVIQALIAILQFYRQGSLGLTFLRESIFTVSQTGIAKVVLFENVLVRPYGLLPHPNILAFFLAITLMLSFFYPLVFDRQMFHVEHKWKYRFILMVQLLAIILVFSKAVLLGLLYSAIYASLLLVEWINIRTQSIVPRGTSQFHNSQDILFHVEQKSDNFANNVPRGTSYVYRFIEKCSTWNNFKKMIVMFHVEHVVLICSLTLLILLVASSVNHYYAFNQPLFERIFLLNGVREIFDRYPFYGIGIGQWVLGMQSFFGVHLEPWQYQPIHNTFLQVFVELGLIGVSLFAYFVIGLFVRVFQNVPRGTMLGILIRCMLILLLVVSVFDHYLWDIQQGQLLFWLILGCAGGSLIFRNIDK